MTDDSVYSFGRVGPVRADRIPGSHRNYPLSEERIIGIDRLTMTAKPDRSLEIAGNGEVLFRIRRAGERILVEAGEAGPETRLEFQGRNLWMVKGEGPAMNPAVWSAPGGAGGGIAGSTVLLQDGSLYRIIDRAGRVPSYGLLGWRTSCPYFGVTWDRNGWEFLVHPSGSALLAEGRGHDLLIFFAVAVSGILHRKWMIEEVDS